MTAQFSETLIADAGSIELPTMRLYEIVTGDIDKPRPWPTYVFATKGDAKKMTMCSALWRGYISSYRLTAQGTLILERLEYPFTEDVQPVDVHEPLNGDFWLDLRESFMGDGFLVPFVDGKVVADRTRWKPTEGVPEYPVWSALEAPAQANPLVSVFLRLLVACVASASMVGLTYTSALPHLGGSNIYFWAWVTGSVALLIWSLLPLGRLGSRNKERRS
jgi:hypothetical protein